MGKMKFGFKNNGNVKRKVTPTVYIVGGSTIVAKMFRDEGYDVINHAYVNCDPDFICFTGGADIHPRLYNEVKLDCTHPGENRDREECTLIRRWEKKRKLGICRGGQLLNVMAGGKMWQDVDRHDRDHDMIDLLITKEPVKVTSTHHQMMIPAEHGLVCGIAFEAKNFQSGVEREKPEYDTEVVWYDKENSLCFQPHPEYNYGPAGSTRKYFFDLINYIWK